MSDGENLTLTDGTRAWVAPGQMYEGTHYLLQSPASSRGSPSEVVLCVHGIGSYHTTFTKLALHLVQQGYTVLSLDLLGRGFSQPSANGHYGREEHVQQIYRLLQHLQFWKDKFIHVIGHSMGGCLSTLFTSTYPNVVKSLSLIAPAGMLGFFPIEFVKWFCPCLKPILRSQLSNREASIKAWRDDFYSHEGKSLEIENEFVHDLNQMYDNNSHASDAFWLTVVEFPLTDISKDIAVVAQQYDLPIALFWGKNDKAVPFSNLDRWTNIIQQERKKHFGKNKSDKELNLYVKTMDKCAHAMLGEFYDIMHKEITSFIFDFPQHANATSKSQIVVSVDSH